jgi:UDP-glucose 4-epimerase
MRVIITGGAGFIGQNVVKLLIKDGHDVFVLDNYSTGSRDNHIPDARYFEADVTNPDELGKVMTSLVRYGPVDGVIHLAAKASIVPSIEHPEAYFATNVDGTANVLHAAYRAGVKKFIYAASGSCYGIPREIPTGEGCPVDPLYPYALTKYLAERYALGFCRTYGIACVSLRLFNVFGPRMCLTGGYGGLFSAILPQKFNGTEVITIGDGEQSRDFVYVEDVARAFKLASEFGPAGSVFNIGTGRPVSVNEILKLLEIQDSQVFRMPDRPGEPRKTQADISRIQRRLGWSPTVSFEEGLKAMVADAEYWRQARVYTREESLKSQEKWYACFGRPLTA